MVDVRGATPADSHGLATVHVESWRAAYRGLMPDEVLAGLSITDREHVWADRLTTPSPRTSVVVAVEARRVVGFAAVGPPLVADDRADPTVGDLHALYLAPDRWGRGIGAPLHAAALDRLVAHGFIRAGLWLLDGNRRAERFYLRHGWTDTGRTQIDHGPQEVELYERRLQRSLAEPSSWRS